MKFSIILNLFIFCFIALLGVNGVCGASGGGTGLPDFVGTTSEQLVIDNWALGNITSNLITVDSQAISGDITGYYNPGSAGNLWVDSLAEQLGAANQDKYLGFAWTVKEGTNSGLNWETSTVPMSGKGYNLGTDVADWSFVDEATASGVSQALQAHINKQADLFTSMMMAEVNPADASEDFDWVSADESEQHQRAEIILDDESDSDVIGMVTVSRSLYDATSLISVMSEVEPASVKASSVSNMIRAIYAEKETASQSEDFEDLAIAIDDRIVKSYKVNKAEDKKSVKMKFSTSGRKAEFVDFMPDIQESPQWIQIK